MPSKNWQTRRSEIIVFTETEKLSDANYRATQQTHNIKAWVERVSNRMAFLSLTDVL